MLWSQPLPIRLRVYSRHDYSHFGVVPGRTPDIAGALRQHQGGAQRVLTRSENFFGVPYIFIICHISFTHRFSIVRYPAGNQAVIDQRMKPQRRIFWDRTWADIRPMFVYTLESNPPMSDRLDPVWTRYVTDIGRSLAG